MSETHKFTAAEESPDGVRVAVTITVPIEIAWLDVRELLELAGMTASRGMTVVNQNREMSQKHEDAVVHEAHVRERIPS